MVSGYGSHSSDRAAAVSTATTSLKTWSAATYTAPTRIVPEWQPIDEGDKVSLHPDVGLSVALVEPGRSLVLRGGIPLGRVPAPYEFTWAFVLRDEPGGGSWLVVRERYGYSRWWAPYS
jgi:hypothetical protein